MSITSRSQRRQGRQTEVTVVSDLSGVVYYHWYADGAFVARTTSPRRKFEIRRNDEVRIVVQDTNSDTYDPEANAPTGYPARRTLNWLRSLDTDVAYYLIEQKKGVGSFAEIGRLKHRDHVWEYEHVTDTLDDLTSYTWQITAVDLNGEAGPAVTIGPVTIVRRPNSPNFGVTFNAGPTTVQFAAA